MLIYKATNLINGKIYIGQTIHTLEERKRRHINCAKLNIEGGCRHFWRAIRKYGEENFEWTVLEFCETIEELGERESYYIEKFNSTDKTIGYNLKGGGFNPYLSEETKRKIGESQKGKLNHMYGKKGKDNPTSIMVYNVTNDAYYDSATECAKQTGLELSKICAVCRGERATTGNKVFRYVIDGKIQEVIPKTKRKTKRVKQISTGRIFETIREACEYAYGTFYKDLYKKIKKEKDFIIME